MKKTRLSKREKILLGSLPILFICVLLVAAQVEPETDANGLTVQEQIEMSKKQREERAIQNRPSKDDKDMSVDACVYAREVVKENLKSPRSADFEGSCNSSTTRLSTNKYSVSGYLYAENAFGASLRSFYKCMAEFTGETWKVSCEVN